MYPLLFFPLTNFNITLISVKQIFSPYLRKRLTNFNITLISVKHPDDCKTKCANSFQYNPYFGETSKKSTLKKSTFPKNGTLSMFFQSN